MKDTKERTAMRACWLSIGLNAILSAFKFTAGALSASFAMISDAAHSASDVLTTLVVMIGVKISSKSSDFSHPYGHERFECVAAIVLSAMLLATGIGIGYAGVAKLAQGLYQTLETPGTLALAAAIVSIAVKEAMYRFTIHYAKTLRSSALHADAWHHRSDALSSIGSFIGILGARAGAPILDPLASLVICFFIVKAACGVFVDAIRKMTDESCDAFTQRKIYGTVSGIEGVGEIKEIKTRKFADKIFVEITLIEKGEMSLCQAGVIALKCESEVEREFECVKKCDVRVIPYPPDCGE